MTRSGDEYNCAHYDLEGSCPVCRKGFQDRRKLVAHHEAQGAASAVLGRAAELGLEAAVRAARPAVLACTPCPKRQHWLCMGLPAAPQQPLLAP
ncbi:MAG: hypothetical protein KIT86_24680 [Hydrogenophaga sp.]|uniref:hypothetical protein n=1 Tax=Hydrogenophaga sp. TaxID=1904254 RepID=UPI00261FD8EC|nr:hypothetical protein [Hydrogenophaga sp.]MCW5672867.1 hypothetical protein [Hydrogenophaga sp.]